MSSAASWDKKTSLRQSQRHKTDDIACFVETPFAGRSRVKINGLGSTDCRRLSVTLRDRIMGTGPIESLRKEHAAESSLCVSGHLVKLSSGRDSKCPERYSGTLPSQSLKSVPRRKADLRPPTNVAFWYVTDVGPALVYVRCWGRSGPRPVVCRCRLLTRSRLRLSIPLFGCSEQLC
jgi:hypothetical protein